MWISLYLKRRLRRLALDSLYAISNFTLASECFIRAVCIFIGLFAGLAAALAGAISAIGAIEVGSWESLALALGGFYLFDRSWKRLLIWQGKEDDSSDEEGNTRREGIVRAVAFLFAVLVIALAKWFYCQLVSP